MMTREEFENKRFRFNQLQGLVNMKLRDKRLKLSLDEALRFNGVTLEEFNEMGMDYDKDRNEIVKIRYVSYNDFETIEEEKQPQDISVITDDDKCVQMADIIKNQDLENLKELINNYDILLEMIKHYKLKLAGQDVEGDAPANNKFITIELPFEEEKDFRKTYRVNKIIAKQFEEFCNEHKEYKVKDLLSQALKEYMDKYR